MTTTASRRTSQGKARCNVCGILARGVRYTLFRGSGLSIMLCHECEALIRSDPRLNEDYSVVAELIGGERGKDGGPKRNSPDDKTPHAISARESQQQ